MPSHDEIVAWIKGASTRELLALHAALEEALDLPKPTVEVPWDAREHVLTGPALPLPGAYDHPVDVILEAPGPDRVTAVKLVRDVAHVGIAEAKGMVERCPVCLREEISRDEGETIARRLREAGLVVRLRG